MVYRPTNEPTPDAAPLIDVSILGPLEVRKAGAVIRLPGRRHGELLVDLLLGLGRRVSTETLVDDLWGATPPPSATKTVHKYVSALRRALDSGIDGVLATDGAGYVLRLPVTAVDARRFEALVADAHVLPGAEAVDVLREAEQLWRGDALDGFSHLEWARPAAERLEELRLAAAERRLGLLVSSGRHAEALPELEQLTFEHPSREELAGQLMLACGLAGRRGDALAAFQRLRRQLAEDLGIEPSSRLLEIERQILAGSELAPREPEVTVTASSAARASGRAERNRHGRVPIPMSSFVGRSRLLERLQHALTQARLVTLTGPGGSGKTRVALEALSRRDRGVRREPIFVDLSSVQAAQQVIPTVVNALGLQDQPGTETGMLLQESLDSGPCLLVLDNCEHLRAAVAELVATLLANCPDLRILATSREPLGLAGEQIRPVPPLDVPADKNRDTHIEQFEAVQLFLARTREADPSFTMDEHNRTAVAEICSRLDGMPLALELAAAQIPAMTVADMAARLDDRFRLLDTSGGRPQRQATLRATIDWSYGLLSAQERLVFGRLSIFPGTFDVAAGAAVGGLDTIDRGGIVGALAGLVRRSMVLRAEDVAGAARYRLLDTLRAYGREVVSSEAEAAACRAAHAHHFAGLVARADTARPSDGDSWHDAIGGDYHNLRVALEHAVDNEPELGSQLVYALSRYWCRTDQVLDGLRSVDQLLQDARLEPIDRAKVLCCAAELRTEHGEAIVAEQEAAAALAVFEHAHDERGRARAAFALGRALGNSGRLAPAVELMSEALKVFATTDPVRWATGGLALGHVRLAQGDSAEGEQRFAEILAWAARHHMDFISAKALWLLGATARHRGRFGEARDRCERALDTFSKLHDRSAVAHVRMTLGDIARLDDDPAAARSFYDEAYETLADIGDTRCTASAMKNLADLERHGDPPRAATLYLNCVERRRTLGDRSGAAEALEGLAGALADNDRAVIAATVLGHSRALRSETGSNAPEVERTTVDGVEDHLLGLLTSAELAEALSAGAAMSLDEMVSAAHTALGDEHAPARSKD